MKQLSMLFMLLFLTITIFAQDLSEFQKEIYINETEDSLPYRILYPIDYEKDTSQNYPLVLFLHGAGERGNDNEIQLVHGAKLFADKANRTEYPAIVVFPQCATDNYWARVDRTEIDGKRSFDFPFYEQPNIPMQMVIELVEQLLENEKIDTSRLYVAGLSMGGMGTFELLARMPETFAAAIPICGGSNPLLAPLYAPHTSMWIFHGADDSVVPVQFSQKMYHTLQQAGAEVKYSEYPGVNHNSWDNAFAEPDFLKWLFSWKKL
ncbi:MAG: prolyl oligopeptidase family serine peptidase [Chitinophagales bacterium]